MTYDQLFDDDDQPGFERTIAVDALEIEDETPLTETDLMVMLSGMVGGVHGLHGLHELQAS